MYPAEPKVTLSGGTDFNNQGLIWGTLNQVLAKPPDMILLRDGCRKGAELVAAI